MYKGGEYPTSQEQWSNPNRQFPILPTRPVLSIPVQEPPVMGNHISDGERSEFAVVGFLGSPYFESVVGQVKHVARNQYFDKQGIDARLHLNTYTPEGVTIADIVGRDEFAIQVKSGDRSVHHFIRDRAKRERDRALWLDKGLILMNGTYPDEFKAADFALQMMLLSGHLFEPEAIQSLVAALDQDIRDCVTHHYIMPPVIDKRDLLIRKFYPDFDPRHKQHLADLFIDAG